MAKFELLVGALVRWQRVTELVKPRSFTTGEPENLKKNLLNSAKKVYGMSPFGVSSCRVRFSVN